VDVKFFAMTSPERIVFWKGKKHFPEEPIAFALRGQVSGG
jgi:hypothetical protein